MRIVFAGTPEFAAKHLNAIISDDSGHKIIAVYTQPDRPAGRGKKLTASSVKILAQKANIPLYQPISLNSSEEQGALSSLNADLMVVVAYGLILPVEILKIPKYGCINVHASLLPRWRGAAPIQRAIEAGDSESGITIMQMDSGLDTGDILGTVNCEIEFDETAGTLEQKMSKIGPSKLIDTLSIIEKQTLFKTKQDHSQSTYAEKIGKEELQIDWSMPAEILQRKILAFIPYQTTHTYLNGVRIKIWNSTIGINCKNILPGTIINTSNEGILVSAGMGCILLTELQLPGGTRLKISELLRSKSNIFSTGNIFGFEG